MQKFEIELLMWLLFKELSEIPKSYQGSTDDDLEERVTIKMLIGILEKKVPKARVVNLNDMNDSEVCYWQQAIQMTKKISKQMEVVHERIKSASSDPKIEGRKKE